MTVVWNEQQTEAIEAIDDWYRSRSKNPFRLYGFAGTGKTTILKYLSEKYDIKIGAFTGKAAHVLLKKGCPAQTIHSMIYRIFDKPFLRIELAALDRKEKKTSEDHNRMREIVDELDKLDWEVNEHAFDQMWGGICYVPCDPPEFIAIDEASMVDERLGEDLMSFGIPILVVADPGQLPPISGRGYFIQDEPDILLTEITRQAAESGIIRMATAVREGERLYADDYKGDAEITRHIPLQWFTLPDLQLLCGRNITRNRYNTDARKALGFEGVFPVAGDKLCCWRNNRHAGLLNGSLWRVLEAYYPVDKGNPYFDLDLRSEDDPEIEIKGCRVHKRTFTEADPYRGWDWNARKLANEFEYGYALTVHKAQGSEWHTVVLVDESFCFREAKANWLYTGITRAREKIVVVR